MLRLLRERVLAYFSFQLPAVSWSLMNDGDVFVVDARSVIFVWSGRHANYVEKIQVRFTLDLLLLLEWYYPFDMPHKSIPSHFAHLTHQSLTFPLKIQL